MYNLYKDELSEAELVVQSPNYRISHFRLIRPGLLMGAELHITLIQPSVRRNSYNLGASAQKGYCLRPIMPSITGQPLIIFLISTQRIDW